MTMQSRSTDILVVGAGAFGLWTARAARAAGASVRIVEARRAGSGASGGVLGALMAHTPDRWNAEKAFQRDALLALPAAVAELEAASRMSVGYGRVGRAIPLRSANFASKVPERAAGAAAHWRGATYAPRDGADAASFAPPGWLDPNAAPLGLVEDGLAARIAPAAYVRALAHGASIEQGATFLRWVDGAADLSSGERVATGACVFAAGYEAFALIDAALQTENHRGGEGSGGGVKGQAAWWAAGRIAAPTGAPLIYDDGVYIVPHADGSVAVGSTSRADWTGAPDETDPSDAPFIDRAQALCPALRGRAPDRLWAGVRPRARGRAPLVGRLPVSAPLWAATGGYKIGLGVAHLAAQALVDRILGASDPTPLPDTYNPMTRMA